MAGTLDQPAPARRIEGEGHSKLNTVSVGPHASFTAAQAKGHEADGKKLVAAGHMPAADQVLSPHHGAEHPSSAKGDAPPSTGGDTPAQPAEKQKETGRDPGPEQPARLKNGDEVKEPKEAFSRMDINQSVVAKDGKVYTKLRDEDGSERQIIEDPTTKNKHENILHADGTHDEIDRSPGNIRTQNFDSKGTLRSSDDYQSKTADGKFARTHKEQWDEKGNKRYDSLRYSDDQTDIDQNGKALDPKAGWHEDTTLTTPEGLKYRTQIDGDVTKNTTIYKDQSWDMSVQTMNVPVENPVRGGPKTTMTTKRSHYDSATGQITDLP